MPFLTSSGNPLFYGPSNSGSEALFPFCPGPHNQDHWLFCRALTELQNFCQDRAVNKSFGKPYFGRVM